jgi:hypothetical protein
MARIVSENDTDIWVAYDSNKVPASQRAAQDLVSPRCSRKNAQIITMEHIQTLNDLTYVRFVCGVRKK